MIRRPPRSTLHVTLFPYTTLSREKNGGTPYTNSHQHFIRIIYSKFNRKFISYKRPIHTYGYSTEFCHVSFGCTLCTVLGRNSRLGTCASTYIQSIDTNVQSIMVHPTTFGHTPEYFSNMAYQTIASQDERMYEFHQRMQSPIQSFLV
jgi:hypothetical protein